MAKTLPGPLLGRRLVEEGIITEEQFHNCTDATLYVNTSQLPTVSVTITIDSDQFRRLLGETSDDQPT